MPKDEKGYFIVNKTVEQLGQENEITNILKKADVVIDSMENSESVFLSVPEQ